MKNFRIALLLVPLMIIALIIVYKYSIDVYNENTLSSITILESEKQTPANFDLSPTEKDLLFRSLHTKDTPLEDVVFTDSFQVTLVNKWNLTKVYELIHLKNDGFAISEDNQKTYYELIDPEFFKAYPGFDSIYKDLMAPEVAIMSSNVSYAFNEVEGIWSFKRLNQTWNESAYPGQTENEAEPIIIKSNYDSLYLTSHKIPDEAHLNIVDKESQITVFSDYISIDNLPYPKADGLYTYEVTLDWNHPSKPYAGNAFMTFNVSIDRPAELSFTKFEIVQGDFLEVELLYEDLNDSLLLEQNLTKNLEWHYMDDSYKALIPTNYHTRPGNYTFRMGTLEQVLTVHPRDFKVQHLTVDTSISNATRNDEAYAEYNKYFVPVRKQSNPDRYFDDRFIMPTSGRLTTEFGEQRTVNGEPTSYRHSGLDIASLLGTDIHATNTGKVVFAMKLILTGNTVIIDHGGGIFSVYEHMDEILVEEGQMVNQADLIGKMGTTGFSTGSHLHFMISFYDTNLEPGYFIFGTEITKENYSDLTN